MRAVNMAATSAAITPSEVQPVARVGDHGELAIPVNRRVNRRRATAGFPNDCARSIDLLDIEPRRFRQIAAISPAHVSVAQSVVCDDRVLRHGCRRHGDAIGSPSCLPTIEDVLRIDLVLAAGQPAFPCAKHSAGAVCSNGNFLLAIRRLTHGSRPLCRTIRSDGRTPDIEIIPRPAIPHHNAIAVFACDEPAEIDVIRLIPKLYRVCPCQLIVGGDALNRQPQLIDRIVDCPCDIYSAGAVRYTQRQHGIIRIRYGERKAVRRRDDFSGRVHM